MNLGDFMRKLADDIGGTYSTFNKLSILAYPMPNGELQNVFGSVINTTDTEMIGFTSNVNKWDMKTDFKGLLEFNHHQCYAKVTISGDNIYVAAVTVARYTSEVQMAEMIYEVARVANQLTKVINKDYN